MNLQTKRLKLREFDKDDIEGLVEVLDNINITKYLAVVPHPYDKEDAKGFIDKCKKRAEKEPRLGYNFAIENKENSKFLGSISIGKAKKDKEVGVLGYWLGEEYWRNGYMSEALDRLLEFAFEKLELRRVQAEVYPENTASQKLLEKFDFKKEGVRRQGQKVKATEKVHDVIMYGLLKENYENKNK